ncbi:hypothetical protein N7G274_008931 [Stereocaulon virgatum]|uniref:Uncharacterized protein n=1 Tax=Stereocaulon virgatum TaxID=373712 RepID=A0ABR4A1Q2_9LECA
MPFLNINNGGQPLSDHEIQRNHILHGVSMVFESTTSLERQVATLQDKNEDMGRELIRSNLRYTNTRINLQKLDDELKRLKSTNAHLEVQIGAFVKVVAQAEGQIGYLEEANSQLHGQLDHLHQLNRQLTQGYGQVTGLLTASKTQYQEAVGQVTVLKTQDQLSEDVVESNGTVIPRHSDTMIHAVKDFVRNGPGATDRPKLVDIHDQQPEVPTFAKGQLLTPLLNDTVVPCDTAQSNHRHSISTRPFTSSTEVNVQPATSSETTANKSPELIMPRLVRGGKDVEDSFQRFLRNQNSYSAPAHNVSSGASLTPKHDDAVPRKLMPEPVPFTPSASVTPPSGTLKTLNESFAPAGRIQPTGLKASSSVSVSAGKKPLHSSESLVQSGAKNVSNEFTFSYAMPKLDSLQPKPVNASTSSNVPSAIAGTNRETVLLPHQRTPTALKVEPVPSADGTSVTQDAPSSAMSTVKPVTLITTMDDSKLPPQKRALSSVTGNQVGQTSDDFQAHVTVDASTASEALNVPNVPVKGEISISASAIDAATKKWLDSFDDQTTLVSNSHHVPSVAAEGESLISLPSSPQVEKVNIVPLPPGYIPMTAATTTTIPATSTKPSNTSEAYTIPKDEKTLASEFMEAAKKKISSFTAKYASDPKAETRKELAELGRALRSKPEAEEAGRFNVLEYLATDYVPRKIIGTHVLGELLDEATKAHILMEDSRGDWEPPALNWKPVEKDGKLYYVL